MVWIFVYNEIVAAVPAPVCANRPVPSSDLKKGTARKPEPVIVMVLRHQLDMRVPQLQRANRAIKVESIPDHTLPMITGMVMTVPMIRATSWIMPSLTDASPVRVPAIGITSCALKATSLGILLAFTVSTAPAVVAQQRPSEPPSHPQEPDEQQHIDCFQAGILFSARPSWWVNVNDIFAQNLISVPLLSFILGGERILG